MNSGEDASSSIPGQSDSPIHRIKLAFMNYYHKHQVPSDTRCFSLLVVITFLMGSPATSSHLLGGYISYAAVDERTYDITVHLLTEVGFAGFGSSILSFGDGTRVENFTEVSVDTLSSGAFLLTSTIRHTYNTADTYELSYTEFNYSGVITNIVNSGNTPFFVTAQLIVSPAIGTNRSPVLQLYRDQRGSVNQRQRINPAPWDPDQDSLSYQLVVPREATQTPIADYAYPNDTSFYADPTVGNQANDSLPTYSVSPATGEILWDAPGTVGTYVIAYQITQWRRIANAWTAVGTTEVVLIDRITNTPGSVAITAPPSVCLPPGEAVQARFALDAPAAEPRRVRVFSDLPGGQVNGAPVNPGSVIELSLRGDRELLISRTEEIPLVPHRPYRVVVQVATPEQIYTASWAVAVGCIRLPADSAPEPIVRPFRCNDLLIYPNPATEEYIQVCLPAPSDQPSQVRIIDSGGRIIYQTQVTLPEEVFRINHYLPPGLYILQINQYAQKFLVSF